MDAAGIASGEETGAAGCADGALAIGMGKGDTTLHKPVDVGCANVRIAQAANRVPTLLVATNPQDVRLQGSILLACLLVYG